MASKPLAATFPDRAARVSHLLQSSLNPGTSRTYDSGMRSFADFCSLNLLGSISPIPADPLSLCMWADHVTHRSDRPLKPSSVRKYLSAIRFAHLSSGYQWDLAEIPQLSMVLSALEKEFPESGRLLKVPMSVGLLLLLCEHITGWPDLSRLAFEDLLWVTLSSIMLFGALRGGEATVSSSSARPILLGKMVSFLDVPGSLASGVLVRVPRAKTAQFAEYQDAFAIDSHAAFILNPSLLLRAYRSAARSLSPPIPVEGDYPAFRMKSGSVASRDFMVSRARSLAARAGVSIRDAEGNQVPFSAASWRAGYVLSARSAGVDEFTIRSSGRWASSSGPLPYSHASTASLQEASQKIVTFALKSPVRARFASGVFSSQAVFEFKSF